jgi:hypothetical protein
MTFDSIPLNCGLKKATPFSHEELYTSGVI